MNNTNIKIAKQLIKIAKELISSKYYDVSSYKNDIKDFIQKCRKNEKPVSHRKDYTFTSIFYRALRKKINNNSEQNNELNNEEISRYYTSNINKILPIENQGTWKQYSTSKKNQIKDGKTYNLYYTIQFDDRTDIENYINFIKDVIPEIEKYESRNKRRSINSIIRGYGNHYEKNKQQILQSFEKINNYSNYNEL